MDTQNLNTNRLVATDQLKDLAVRHLLEQETILNIMRRLNEESQKLQVSVQESQDKLMAKFKQAQELLQKQLQESQKFILDEAEKKKKQIQEQLESMNELSHEKNAEFMQEQQKILGQYKKFMQRGK